MNNLQGDFPVLKATVPVKCKLTVTRNSILDPRYSSIEHRGSRIEYRGSSFEYRESSFEYRASSFESSGSSFEKRKQRTYRSINCSNQIKKTSLHLLISRRFTVHSFTFNSRWRRSSNSDGRSCLFERFSRGNNFNTHLRICWYMYFRADVAAADLMRASCQIDRFVVF